MCTRVRLFIVRWFPGVGRCLSGYVFHILSCREQGGGVADLILSRWVIHIYVRVCLRIYIYVCVCACIDIDMNVPFSAVHRAGAWRPLFHPAGSYMYMYVCVYLCV